MAEATVAGDVAAAPAAPMTAEAEVAKGRGTLDLQETINLPTLFIYC